MLLGLLRPEGGWVVGGNRGLEVLSGLVASETKSNLRSISKVVNGSTACMVVWLEEDYLT